MLPVFIGASLVDHHRRRRRCNRYCCHVHYKSVAAFTICQLNVTISLVALRNISEHQPQSSNFELVSNCVSNGMTIISGLEEFENVEIIPTNHRALDKKPGTTLEYQRALWHMKTFLRKSFVLTFLIFCQQPTTR